MRSTGASRRPTPGCSEGRGDLARIAEVAREEEAAAAVAGAAEMAQAEDTMNWVRARCGDLDARERSNLIGSPQQDGSNDGGNQAGLAFAFMESYSETETVLSDGSLVAHGDLPGLLE